MASGNNLWTRNDLYDEWNLITSAQNNMLSAGIVVATEKRAPGSTTD